MSVQIAQVKIVAESVTDVQAATRKMFAAIDAAEPEGIRYASLLLADGETFVAVVQVDDGVENPIPAFPEFRELQELVAASRAEPRRSVADDHRLVPDVLRPASGSRRARRTVTGCTPQATFPGRVSLNQRSSGMSTPAALIMGGSSGIGEATARVFLKEGSEVVITGRNEDRLRSAVERLRDAHVHAEVQGHSVDARDHAQLQGLFERLGEITHLVLALSGAAGAGPIRELDLEELRAGLEGKTLPYIASVQAALPKMSSNGSITMVTAGSAQSALPGTAGLAAVNGALEAAIRPLALELAPIRINAVSPGVIDTRWWEATAVERRVAIHTSAANASAVGRVGRPEEVAHLIHALATNEFVTGVTVPCDGGLRLTAGRAG
jgi:NAD(P)-dependent dehydrogenase (short-subunit alcohol dehydrogenase family)